MSVRSPHTLRTNSKPLNIPSAYIVVHRLDEHRLVVEVEEGGGMRIMVGDESWDQ